MLRKLRDGRMALTGNSLHRQIHRHILHSARASHVAIYLIVLYVVSVNETTTKFTMILTQSSTRAQLDSAASPDRGSFCIVIKPIVSNRVKPLRPSHRRWKRWRGRRKGRTSGYRPRRAQGAARCGGRNRDRPARRCLESGARRGSRARGRAGGGSSNSRQPPPPVVFARPPSAPPSRRRRRRPDRKAQTATTSSSPRWGWGRRGAWPRW